MIKNSSVSAFQDHVAHCSKTDKLDVTVVSGHPNPVAQFAEHMSIMHQKFFNVLTAGEDSNMVSVQSWDYFLLILNKSENLTNLVFSKIFGIYI